MTTPTVVMPAVEVPTRLVEPIVAAVKQALAADGDHRLFRSGKLVGLFSAKTGTPGEAAGVAISAGLVEVVRTEAKGKSVVEWVRATPAGVRFAAEHDSPKAVLKELRDVLGTTRDGVPTWLDDARRDVALLSERFEERTAELVRRLDVLTDRVDAALRRVDAAGPGVPAGTTDLVPWADAALAYLDQRRTTGVGSNCPLGELFHAIADGEPGLSLPDFQAGLARLRDVRALRLTGPAPGTELADPEYAMMVGPDLCCYAAR